MPLVKLLKANVGKVLVLLVMLLLEINLRLLPLSGEPVEGALAGPESPDDTQRILEERGLVVLRLCAEVRVLDVLLEFLHDTRGLLVVHHDARVLKDGHDCLVLRNPDLRQRHIDA